jgi:hypothetical protein
VLQEQKATKEIRVTLVQPVHKGLLDQPAQRELPVRLDQLEQPDQPDHKESPARREQPVLLEQPDLPELPGQQEQKEIKEIQDQ